MALVEAMKAAGHPVRWTILQALAQAERNVGEIEEATAVGQPSLSQQLAVLRKAGLVTTRRAAKLVYYRLDAERLAELSAAITALAGPVDAAPAKSWRPTGGAAAFARLT